MLTSPKSLAFACALFAAVVGVLTAHLRDYPGAVPVGPMMLLFCGLEGAMLVLLFKTLRGGGGEKTQFSLMTMLACALAAGILMALNLGSLRPRGMVNRVFGWPLFAARTETIFENGAQRQVLSDTNYGNIALDAAIGLCIVTACLILCESFIRLRRQNAQ